LDFFRTENAKKKGVPPAQNNQERLSIPDTTAIQTPPPVSSPKPNAEISERSPRIIIKSTKSQQSSADEKGIFTPESFGGKSSEIRTSLKSVSKPRLMPQPEKKAIADSQSKISAIRIDASVSLPAKAIPKHSKPNHKMLIQTKIFNRNFIPATRGLLFKTET
jgi:hypothetical protein